MANVTQRGAQLHEEQLAGRTQQVFFSAEAEENYLYHGSFEVDLEKRAEIDAAGTEPPEVNAKIRALLEDGHGGRSRSGTPGQSTGWAWAF